MRLLYFGWVRQRIGTGGETMALPQGVYDVAGLIAHLKTKGEGYQAAFADVAALRVAVNQEMAPLDAPVNDADEVALFPPMTGGCAPVAGGLVR